MIALFAFLLADLRRQQLPAVNELFLKANFSLPETTGEGAHKEKRMGEWKAGNGVTTADFIRRHSV